MKDLFEDANIIDVYTRKQAIEDGVLVDVSETAREAGYKYPVAVTHAVWAEVIVPTEDARKLGQSEEGRLWDVLSVLRHCIVASKGDMQELLFKVLVAFDGIKPKPVKLKAVCGPGDQGEPVITIMYPSED
ncbi:MAG: DUF6573 family protein [Bacillota bacterium]